MRSVRLSLYFLVGLFLGGFAVLSYADQYPAVAKYGIYATAEEKCIADKPPHIGAFDHVVVFNLSSVGCIDTTGGQYMMINVTWSCPYGGTMTYAAGMYQCMDAPACPTGQIRDVDTGACKVDCQAGTSVSTNSQQWSVPGSTLPSELCYQGCAVTYGDGICLLGGCSVWGPFNRTGQSCGTQPQMTGQAPQCPAGKVHGQVNGAWVCVSPGPSSVTSSKTTKTTTATQTAPNGDQSTTQKQTVTICNGDDCTTTVQQTNTGGGVSGGLIGSGSGGSSSGTGGGDISSGQNGTTSGTVTQSKGDFCKDNPQVAGCTAAGTFIGSCDAGFTCEGDAIQCAQAKAAWQTACSTSFPDGAGDPTADDFELPAKQENLAFQTVSLGGGGSCPQPITVAGIVEISFDGMCQYAAGIKPVVIAMAWIAAAFIVWGAYRKKESA